MDRLDFWTYIGLQVLVLFVVTGPAVVTRGFGTLEAIYLTCFIAGVALATLARGRSWAQEVGRSRSTVLAARPGSSAGKESI